MESSIIKSRNVLVEYYKNKYKLLKKKIHPKNIIKINYTFLYVIIKYKIYIALKYINN